MTTTPATPAPGSVLARRHFFGRLLAGLAGLTLPWRVGPARADTQAVTRYLGEIMVTPFGYAASGWALCNGQLLLINSNMALYSLIGTTYGGNGVTNFALPDLRGRVPIHLGQGPGLAARALGATGGETTHIVTPAEMPAHTHQARASSLTGTVVVPSASQVPARNAAGVPQWGTGTSVGMNVSAITTVGGDQSHENRQPFVTLNYVIAVTGIFPS